MRSSELQQQQLCSEVARLNQALQAKEHVIRYTALTCCCLAGTFFYLFEKIYFKEFSSPQPKVGWDWRHHNTMATYHSLKETHCRQCILFFQYAPLEAY